MNVSGAPDQLAAPIPAAALQIGMPESDFYVRSTDPSAYTSQSGPSETEVKIWRTVMWGLGAIGGIGGPIAGLQASGSTEYMAMPGGQAVLGGQSPQYVAAASFRVGSHGSMPSPRPDDDSHHGVMSAWMWAHYERYDPRKAPAVLMPTSAHQKTFGVYLAWRKSTTEQMGGVFDWSNVSEAEIHQLSEAMFNAAGVPRNIRSQYWKELEKYKATLEQ
jgi:HNH/Endo VII superfamily toxin with a SHH signature